MKANVKPQIELVADLFDDLKPRTSNMAAKELNLKNKSVSRWLGDLVAYDILQVVGKGTCEVTGKQANYYSAIVWIKKKKGLDNGK
jgi:Mn-dependent DtxR family transcriptional regulator